MRVAGKHMHPVASGSTCTLFWRLRMLRSVSEPKLVHKGALQSQRREISVRFPMQNISVPVLVYSVSLIPNMYCSKVLRSRPYTYAFPFSNTAFNIFQTILIRKRANILQIIYFHNSAYI